MDVTPWKPVRKLEDIRARLNSIFGGQAKLPFPEGRETMTVSDWTPAVDISETETEFLMRAESPETKKGEVRVTMQDGVLTNRGEREREREENTGKIYCVGCSGYTCRNHPRPNNEPSR